MSKVFLFALGACVLTAAGCTSTPPAPKTDNIIPYDKTLDTVHTREDSVWEYVESRAGAAVRTEEMSHVLFNAHYEADPDKLAAIEAAKKASASSAAQSDAQKAAAAKKTAVKASDAKKDKSIYSQPKKGKSVSKS